ncbi:outer membrane beta-barrel protein [Geothrix sp. 21YS21S-4]|uniref:outer membrane beta-barrel protein n=1 Tax=Geothrix sp. 21YS21S-4 TaxID=3068889 RepID=UPI0027BA1991|nr:outer membrane beta-barrel protein [Geothrix sp. 21YS21S-4]
MKTNIGLALCLTGAALASAPLTAQDIRWGLQGTLSFPTSDLGDKGLLDNALGYGVGAHMLIAFPGGHAIVPRLDYAYFEKSSPTRRVQMLNVGADYNYFLSQQVNRGAYVGAGLGLGMAKFEMNPPGGSDNDTPNAVYGSVSAGYMFNAHMGAELRYVHAKYEPELFGAKPEFTSPVIQASFLYRF